MRNGLNVLLTKFRAMSRARRGLFLVAAGVMCLLVFSRMNGPEFKSGSRSVPESTSREAVPGTSETDAREIAELYKFKESPDGLKESNGVKEMPDRLTELQGPINEPRQSRAPEKLGSPAPPAAPATNDRRQIAGTSAYDAPLIAHTAELAIATKEFARSRTELEEILERHRGYAARLRMVGRRTGSVLSATLRIPSPELISTVSELKSLGDVEQEEQAADEITQQRADLEARLSNAHKTLQRLQELLKKQTYPDGNVRELQRQIAATSAEVNRLEAERQASEHRVVFANVQFSLREEIAHPQESLSAQFHGAAAAGFNEAATSLSAIVLFLIGRGPVVLLWILILFVPARFIWRRSLVNTGANARVNAG